MALIAPMLPISGSAPNGSEWAYEFRWSGLRCLARVNDSAVQLVDGAQQPITTHYPELTVLRAFSRDREMVLDGMIVAVDQQPPSSFPRAVGADVDLPWHVRNVGRPLAYVVFDLLSLNGNDFLSHPYRKRRSVLAGLRLYWPPRVLVPPHFRDGAAEQVQAMARDHQFTGVVAKHLESPYRPGQRSPEWVESVDGRSPTGEDRPTSDLRQNRASHAA